MTMNVQEYYNTFIKVLISPVFS